MHETRHARLSHTPLAQQTEYPDHYDASLLCPIPRSETRQNIQIPEPLPFKGYDIWNAFEVSWLNPKGKPVNALGQFIFPCETPYLIESKSFKLYLNSFNNERFESIHKVQDRLKKDLSSQSGQAVEVILTDLYQKRYAPRILTSLQGLCLDGIEISCSIYQPHPSFLKIKDPTSYVREKLYSDLFKTNCPVTGQPDWASIYIAYTGVPMELKGLLSYLISFRNHRDFHEQCVERIFMDIHQRCKPKELTVYARYTRRGGLDINPMRSNVAHKKCKNIMLAQRLVRQ